MASVVVLDMDDTLFLERDYVLSGFAAVDAVVAKEHGLKGFSESAWRLFCAGVRYAAELDERADWMESPPHGGPSVNGCTGRDAGLGGRRAAAI